MMLNKLRDYRIKRRAISKCKFRKKVIEVYNGMVGDYLGCAHNGHKLKYVGIWKSNTSELHEFACETCPMWYMRKKDELSSVEKELIVACVGEERKK